MIVKNLLAVGAIATLATAASAADVSKADWKINGVMRMDADQHSTETKNGDADKVTTKSSGISLKRTQIGLTGTQGAVSLHLHYNIEGDNAWETNKLWDGYVSNRINDMITLSFGKLNALSQSVENSYEYQDLYITSLAYDMVVANTNGAQVAANFGEHMLTLQVLQGVGSTTSTSTSATGVVTTSTNTFESKGGLTTSLQYSGNINNMIRPILTYSMVRTAGTKAYNAAGTTVTANYGNGYQNQLGAGVQVEVAGAKIDLEYDAVTTLKQKDNDTDKAKTTSSVVAQVRYSVAEFTPFLKLTSDTYKLGADQGIGDLTGMKLALGSEYAMAPGMRLHAFYYQTSTSTKAVSDKTNKVNTAGFNLGVTASL